MASVTLRFSPPEETDIVALRVYEAPASTGPYAQIDRTTAVGTPPDYIDAYTSNAATSTSDWFSIAWESTGGVIGPQSAGVKGGSKTLVGEVVDRVLQRDSSLDANIARQEAEVAVEMWSGSSDVYSITDYTLTQLNGLVYLTLARCYIFGLASGTTESATLGMVSMKSSSTTSTSVDTDALIELANIALNMNTSRVLQIARPWYCYDRPYLVLEA